MNPITHRRRYWFQLLIFLIFSSFTPSLFSQVQKPDYVLSKGFFTVNGKIFNPDGTEFLIRGVNQNHFWGSEQVNLNSINAITNSHSNVVRVVMSNADWQNQSRTPDKKRALVEKYIALGMIPMVEQHDGTCEKEPSFLEFITDVWTDPANVAWLNEYEEYVILNIANEWGPGDSPADWKIWRDSYKTAITAIREAGINNMLVIDSPKCGQGPRAMEVYGQELLAHDPQHNLVFSIHMYGWWRTLDRANEVPTPNSDKPPWMAENELQTMLDLNLPVIVGEFSWKEAESVNYDTELLIKFCHEKQIGWLAWSWNGNGDNVLDMVKNWQYNSDADLKTYGQLIINHPLYGLRATAVAATVFGAPNARPTITMVSPQPDENFQVGDKITLHAKANDSDGNVTKVFFYKDHHKLAEATTAPYYCTWSNVPRGRFQLFAVAWDNSSQTSASEIVEVKVGFREQVHSSLLIAGRDPLKSSDAKIKERLEILGYQVTAINDDDCTPEDSNGKDLVIISATVIPTRIKQKYLDLAKPIVLCESSIYDDMKMTGTKSNVDYGRLEGNRLEIVNSTHPLSAGLTGTIPVYSSDYRLNFCKPYDQATIIASAVDDPEKAVIFTYEPGAMMGNEFAAPALRIGFFLYDDGPDVLTTDGWALFDAAVDYAQTTVAALENAFSTDLPSDFELQQNYPNPFNPTTQIHYILPISAHVRLRIFNSIGQLVSELVNEHQPAGNYSVQWDGNNASGKLIANGIYLYQLVTVTAVGKETVRTRKMMFIK